MQCRDVTEMDKSFKILYFLAVTVTGASALTSAEKSAFTNDVTLAVVGDVYAFFSSGYPPHDIDNTINPNAASVQNFTYNITVNPDNQSSVVVWYTSLGPVGFATNGVAIYNALTRDTTDAVIYETFDNCKGHSGNDGSYHYHQFPVCVGDLANEDEFIGIALDGNPIYGPNASDQTDLLTSSDLDACHGRFVEGRYRYHITKDFPYVIGCYKAEPAESPAGDEGGDGMGPPPGRRKRQTETATCANKEYGAELCDCTSGTLTQCDTLTEDDNDGCVSSAVRASAAWLTSLILTFLLKCN